MKLIPILLIVGGVILIVAARTDRDPRNVIFQALNLKQRVKDPEPIGGIRHENGRRSGGGTFGSSMPDPVTEPGTRTVTV